MSRDEERQLMEHLFGSESGKPKSLEDLVDQHNAERDARMAKAKRDRVRQETIKMMEIGDPKPEAGPSLRTNSKFVADQDKSGKTKYVPPVKPWGEKNWAEETFPERVAHVLCVLAILAAFAASAAFMVGLVSGGLVTSLTWLVDALFWLMSTGWHFATVG